MVIIEQFRIVILVHFHKAIPIKSYPLLKSVRSSIKNRSSF